MVDFDFWSAVCHMCNVLPYSRYLNWYTSEIRNPFYDLRFRIFPVFAASYGWFHLLQRWQNKKITHVLVTKVSLVFILIHPDWEWKLTESDVPLQAANPFWYLLHSWIRCKLRLIHPNDFFLSLRWQNGIIVGDKMGKFSIWLTVKKASFFLIFKMQKWNPQENRKGSNHSTIDLSPIPPHLMIPHTLY